MKGYKASVKTSLYMVYVFSVALIAVSVALPFIVTWYVEEKGRDATLPATIMLTCYPCLPFAAVILVSLRRLLKNILSGLVLGDKNLGLLRATVISCFAIVAITAAAGRQYKPFYIIALAAAASGLTFYIVKCIVGVLLDERREDDLESIEGEL